MRCDSRCARQALGSVTCIARRAGARRRDTGGRARRARAPSPRGEPAADGQKDSRVLRRRSVAELVGRRAAGVPAEAFAVAAPIVEAVRTRGEPALREYAERFGDVVTGGPLFLDRAALACWLASLPAGERARLERVAERIRTVAEAQKRGLGGLTVELACAASGHSVAALQRAR